MGSYEMEIQKILFPEIDKCMEKELYYHLERKSEQSREDLAYCDCSKKKITFRRNAKVWFDSYFNGFSVEKWKKYTILDELSLKIVLSGKFKVVLIGREKIHQDIITTTIWEEIVQAEEPSEFVFHYRYGNGKGMYAFGLEAIEEESKFYGGYYCSDIDANKVRDVKIGIGICTFKRERFIEKNLRILNNAILENVESPLYGHLEVFIADNGQSLERDRLASDVIHINPNRNLGGAGGFTRNLIEIMTHNDMYGITHALLMDDDIVMEPEALVKTYIILSLLRAEYKDTFIGGAMLRIDKQYMQAESGATWNGGYLRSLKANLDLRSIKACLFNEYEEYVEFNAWWYCCFPMTVVREDNLPLPIFIRGDDLEYGLRNMTNLILMNGICVWHEPFENKYSSFLEYYIMRNQLIDNSFHCQWYGAKQLNKTLLHHCLQEIMYYRYKNVELYLRGVKDFLKGPEWLMQQDGEALHKQIMAAGYRGQDLSTVNMGFRYEEYENSRICCDGKLSKIKRFITFNGLFLPAKGDNCVPMAAARSIQFYRKKRVMQYDITAKKAFITEKSVGKSVKYIFKTFSLMLVVPFKIKNAQKAYRTEGLKLRTLEFWQGYLGLNE